MNLTFNQLDKESDDPIDAFEVFEDGRYIGMICEAKNLRKSGSLWSATWNMVPRHPDWYFYTSKENAVKDLQSRR